MHEPAPEGCEYVAVPDTDWRLVEGKRCRQPLCPQPSVAELARTATMYRKGGAEQTRWYAYCADHLYGRWIEDGQVMHRILREVGA